MGNQIFKQSVGIDVSKDELSVCFSQQEAGKKFRIVSTRSFACTALGFGQLDAWIGGHRQAEVALHLLMEATGVYYEEAAYFLQAKGYRLTVLLPNKARAFAKSLDYKSKTDRIDAKMLAQMSLERDLAPWQPAPEQWLKIKRLCRERIELLGEKTAASNRLHAKGHAHQPDSTSLKRAKKLLKFLQKQIQEVEIAIEKAVQNDQDIQQKIDNVCSIKGVGIITAATVIAETNGFALFKNKAQVVSYAGYDVVQNQSGTSIHGKSRISKKGNHHIRRCLHFPALVAIKHVPEFKNLYDRVFQKTKIKMKGAVAVQRKLLVLIYTLYQRNQLFDPYYDQNQNPPALKQSRQEPSPAYAA